MSAWQGVGVAAGLVVVVVEVVEVNVGRTIVWLWSLRSSLSDLSVREERPALLECPNQLGLAAQRALMELESPSSISVSICLDDRFGDIWILWLPVPLPSRTLRKTAAAVILRMETQLVMAIACPQLVPCEVIRPPAMQDLIRTMHSTDHQTR